MQAKKLKKKYLKKKKNKKIQERKKQQQQCVSTVRRVVKSKKGRGRGLSLLDLGHTSLFLNTYDQRVPRH